jgi:hypothetical protein
VDAAGCTACGGIGIGSGRIGGGGGRMPGGGGGRSGRGPPGGGGGGLSCADARGATTQHDAAINQVATSVRGNAAERKEAAAESMAPCAICARCGAAPQF